MFRSEGAVLLLFVVIAVAVFALFAGFEISMLIAHIHRALAGLQR